MDPVAMFIKCAKDQAEGARHEILMLEQTRETWLKAMNRMEEFQGRAKQEAAKQEAAKRA